MKQFEVTKLPKGRRWTDGDVITKKDSNLLQPKIQFYPIGSDLYIKGLYVSAQKKDGKWKREIPVNILRNYRSTTASQINREYDIPVLIQSMICTVWRELGLRQGFMEL